MLHNFVNSKWKHRVISWQGTYFEAQLTIHYVLFYPLSFTSSHCCSTRSLFSSSSHSPGWMCPCCTCGVFRYCAAGPRSGLLEVCFWAIYHRHPGPSCAPHYPGLRLSWEERQAALQWGVTSCLHWLVQSLHISLPNSMIELRICFLKASTVKELERWDSARSVMLKSIRIFKTILCYLSTAGIFNQNDIPVVVLTALWHRGNQNKVSDSKIRFWFLQLRTCTLVHTCC